MRVLFIVNKKILGGGVIVGEVRLKNKSQISSFEIFFWMNECIYSFKAQFLAAAAWVYFLIAI